MSSQKWDYTNEIPDLSGRVAIVTGANTGIGYHTAQQLAIHGAKVYLAGRSESRILAAIAEMKKEYPVLGQSDLLHYTILDLGDLKSVKASASDFQARESRLDILVNNASLLARPLDFNEHGVSVSFTTNQLGPFLFTTELLPLIRKTAIENTNVRIVNVASTSHDQPPVGIKFDTFDSLNVELGPPGPSSDYARYGLSKLANILFAKSLQKMFDTDGIPAIAISLHPGGVKTTGAIEYIKNYKLDPSRLDAALDPIDGAITSLFAATSSVVSQEKERYGGAYLEPFGKLVEPNENAGNEDLADQLWDTCEKVVKVILA